MENSTRALAFSSDGAVDIGVGVGDGVGVDVDGIGGLGGRVEEDTGVKGIKPGARRLEEVWSYVFKERIVSYSWMGKTRKSCIEGNKINKGVSGTYS